MIQKRPPTFNDLFELLDKLRRILGNYTIKPHIFSVNQCLVAASFFELTYNGNREISVRMIVSSSLLSTSTIYRCIKKLVELGIITTTDYKGYYRICIELPKELMMHYSITPLDNININHNVEQTEGEKELTKFFHDKIGEQYPNIIENDNLKKENNIDKDNKTS